MSRDVLGLFTRPTCWYCFLMRRKLVVKTKCRRDLGAHRLQLSVSSTPQPSESVLLVLSSAFAQTSQAGNAFSSRILAANQSKNS
jgi:hypothetical protein